MEELLRMKTAAKLLGVTSQTLAIWNRKGIIKAVRTPGNQRRIPQSEIERLLKEGARE